MVLTVTIYDDDDGVLVAESRKWKKKEGNTRT